jgi:hypothetical protein
LAALRLVVLRQIAEGADGFAACCRGKSISTLMEPHCFVEILPASALPQKNAFYPSSGRRSQKAHMIAAEKDLPQASSGPWYVTDGRGVVGPVDTDLLLRGITSSRIPHSCMVTQPSWTCWRHLHEIREVSRGWVDPTPLWADRHLGKSDVSEDLVSQARDAGEALLLAMHAAVKATRATAALVHRQREPFVGLVTSCAHGPGTEEQLGQVVPRFDRVLAAARMGRGVVGRPWGGELQRCIARRFDAASMELEGVAMVPVFDGPRLLAMMEVVRQDHPFRREDRGILQRIARVVSVR